MAHPVTVPRRSLVATVVAICPAGARTETAHVLDTLRERLAVRTILLTLGDDPQPAVQQDGESTVIDGLVPRYLDNAVAALRLSSLPTLAWWRGCDASAGAPLVQVAALVDRLVLDTRDPLTEWSDALPLVERTALSDLRWTRLTRWRSLTAQFFDAPDVRARLSSYTRLALSGGDMHALRLFAAWLEARLPQGGNLTVGFSPAPVEHPMESMTLSGDAATLRLQRLANDTCIESTLDTEPGASHVVSLGDQSLPALLIEELRVRSRDPAFEDALRRAVSR